MLTENIKQLIIEIQQEVSEKFYSFLKKFELTKKNKTKDSEEKNKKNIANDLINELIIDIDNYKKELGFYKHVQLSDEDRKCLLKLFGNNRSIYEVNYGYLFHFICSYIYRLVSFKKIEEININWTDSEYLNITSAVASYNKIYNFIFNFTKKMIKEKNNNLLDFCKEILPIIFIICEFILKKENYEFIELIKDDSPDFYVLYKDKLNNKNYVWPIEIGGIYVEYTLENKRQNFNYNKILYTASAKLNKFDKYTKSANEFTSKDDINKRIFNKLGKEWELKKPLIALFPINKRICKYELLQIIDELKKLCDERSDNKDYSNVLDELNKEDLNDAKIRFFYLSSFYCDTLIYLLSKKTNFEKSVPARDLSINFKTNTIENKNKSISLYQVEPSFSEEDKKLIEDVIKVLEYDDNILEGNKIKNIHCKNDGDIESIELH